MEIKLAFADGFATHFKTASLFAQDNENLFWMAATQRDTDFTLIQVVLIMISFLSCMALRSVAVSHLRLRKESKQQS